MHKKGFTLVELLAVLIVLGVLATITTTVILNQVNESKNKLNSEQIKIVQSAAIEYGNNEGFNKKEGNTYKVYLNDLVLNGLVNPNLINSLDENIDFYITLTVQCNEVCYFSASDLLKDWKVFFSEYFYKIIYYLKHKVYNVFRRWLRYVFGFRRKSKTIKK